MIASHRIARTAALALSFVLLTGCAAGQLALSKRNLDVQTKMSDTIFLDPASPEQRTIFLQIRNTSDKPDFDIAQDLKATLQEKGYTVTSNPKTANYILQANVLQVGKTDPTAANALFSGGYGGTATAAIGGAMAVGAFGGDGRSMAGAGLAFRLADTIAGAFVKDVYYSVITDLHIQEKTSDNSQTQINSTHNLKQGTSGSSQVTYSKKSNMQSYQTRIMSSANKVNLSFEEALPELRSGLVRSISGLF